MKHEQLLLENQICFLVYRLNRAIGAAYRPLLDELGLTYPQYLVMLVLWEHDSLPVGDICRFLDLDTGTVSPLIKRMEATGLLKRERQASDERTVIVSLTDSGKALEKKALPIPTALGSCLFAESSEYEPLKKTLSLLNRRLDESI
jgi:DNA-binding MarR family transcriptional regulator